MAGRVFSHYRILERIGSGGMSVVYKARDVKLDRLVAMKFLTPHLAADDVAVSRFLQEARAISALNHPHIATIHDLGRWKGEIFLVLEYLPGGTLRSLVRSMAAKGRRLSQQRLLELAGEIAEGLAHAHRHGIIHRDVKADNVMLTAEGRAKIADFGLAKLRGSSHLTEAGAIIGTVAYMSPEQAQGAEVDHRSDLYSLGVVLYEMATAELPFQGPHQAAVLSQILHKPAPPLSGRRTDLDSGLERIVGKLLEKEPSRRYQDAEELLLALRSLRNGTHGNGADVTVTVVQRKRPAKQLRWVRDLPRRRKLLAVLLLAAAILLPPWSGNLLSYWTRRAASVAPGREYELYLQGRESLERHESPENLDHAIKAFEEVVGRNPGHALAHAGLGEAYWRKYSLTRDPQWIERAGESCRRSIELNVSLAPVHITLGLIHAGTGRYEDAVRELKKALSLDPLNTDAYRELGRAYEALGEDKQAEAAYRKAIEFRAAHWAGHNDLGVFCWRRGRYAEAEERFRKVIELAPDSARGYSNLGGLYVMMGRYEGAASTLERSMELRATAGAASNLGTTYFFQHRYAEAVAMMEKAVDLRPGHYRLWGNLGDAYHHVPGGGDKARQAYRRALEQGEKDLIVNPEDASLRASLAGYCVRLGDWKRAEAEIREALRLAPKDVNVLFRAALVYELAGERSKALETVTAALEGGYSKEEIRRHPDLERLRTDSRFPVLVASKPIVGR